MHIVYAVTTCSDKTYSRLFSHTSLKPAFQAQKYHRLLIEGLAVNAEVDVVANPPVNPSLMDKGYVKLPDETEGGARYHYIPAIRNSVLKLICVATGTFFGTLRYARKDSAVIVDCLNRIAALAALLAARLRGCRCVGIVTDIPDIFKGPGFRLASMSIRHCTDYVLLTQAMNDRLNPKGRPYVILEGHADISMGSQVNTLEGKTKPRVCFYAGGVSKQYGVKNLVDGFRMANIPNTQLHIYGPGDYVEELQQIAAEDPRVYYGGMLLNSEVVKKELEATLLVNPRPTDEEFVKYSFPSKTMEYMASGTAVLTTVLPGMPREYYPYVYLLEDETAQGIANTLKQVLSLPDETLHEKGKAAKAFVLNEKNNVVQAEKILKMLSR